MTDRIGWSNSVQVEKGIYWSNSSVLTPWHLMISNRKLNANGFPTVMKIIKNFMVW